MPSTLQEERWLQSEEQWTIGGSTGCRSPPTTPPPPTADARQSYKTTTAASSDLSGAAECRRLQSAQPSPDFPSSSSSFPPLPSAPLSSSSTSPPSASLSSSHPSNSVRHHPSMCILQSSAHSAYIAAAAANSLGPMITERKQQWLDGFLTDLILKTYNHRRQSKELLDYKCDLQEAITRTLAATLCGLDGGGGGGGNGQPPLQFKIYLIGSSLTSIGSSRSDIDLCMVIYNSATGQVDDRYHNRIYAEVMLERISAILERAGLAFQSKVIRANVPILKFFDHNHIEVNLNLNKIVTVQNTMLLVHLCSLDARVAPFLFTVKLWAAKNGINCAYFKSLSSYSLSLMAIFFLQNVVQPAILPPFSQLIDYVVQCTSLFQYQFSEDAFGGGLADPHHHNHSSASARGYSGLHVTSSVPFDAHIIERFPIPSPPPPPPPALMMEEYRNAAAIAAAAIDYHQQQQLHLQKQTTHQSHNHQHQHLTNGKHHMHAPEVQQQANQLFSGSAISRVTFLDSSQLPSMHFPIPPPPPPLPVQIQQATVLSKKQGKSKKARQLKQQQQQQQLQLLQNGGDESGHGGSSSSSTSSSSSSSSSLSQEEMDATKHLPYYYYYYYYYYCAQFQLLHNKAAAAAAAAHVMSTKSTSSLCGSSASSSSSQSDNGDVISSSSSSSGGSCASSLSGSLSLLSISSSSGCGDSTSASTSPSSSPPSTSPSATVNGTACNGSSSSSLALPMQQLESFKSTNVQSLGSLFADFIAFYSDQSVYDSVISVRTGRLMKRTDPHFARSSTTSMETFICIEEPFNHSNTSHSVHNEFMYNFIVKTFRWTRESISKLKLTLSDFV